MELQIKQQSEKIKRMTLKLLTQIEKSFSCGHKYLLKCINSNWSVKEDCEDVLTFFTMIYDLSKTSKKKSFKYELISLKILLIAYLNMNLKMDAINTCTKLLNLKQNSSITFMLEMLKQTSLSV